MADLKREEEKGPEPADPKQKRSPRRTIWIIIALLAAFVVYAYAYETTEVSLDRITDETRQQQLFRVLRALAHPDLLTYESTETATDIGYMVPCPEDGFTPESIDGGAEVGVDPQCADPRDEVVVSGSGFLPNEEVRVFFVPPNGTQLRLATLRTSSSGSFEEVVRLPNRPDEGTQTIRVVSTQTVGSVFNPEHVETASGETVRSPRWSENAKQTFDKIIETIFLALLATTAGTLIAIPLSFFAAKNLMRDFRIPPLQLGFAVVGVPVGVLAAILSTNAVRSLVEALPESALLHGALTIVLVFAALRLLRWAFPLPDSPSTRTTRAAAKIAVAALILLAGQTLAQFAIIGGTWFAANAGPLDFLGEFISTNGDILAAAFGVIVAIAGAVIFGLLGSRIGYLIAARAPSSLQAGLAILLTAAAGAVVALGLGQVVAWLYEIENNQSTVVIPLIVGAIVGGLFGLLGVRRGQLAAGLGVYYTSRTIFNTLRSIEPLIMVIVFVIWVGLGPFAGALALGLHTVAALTKLYSEQVESINPGPVEAIRATGATRLQTVVYGVVPQIVAPYISFTMYRWDINVRMSTIIGFGGGGGIGFLLQQNIGLLNYRAAAAQMLAIAIVVASMDYLSSRLREQFT